MVDRLLRPVRANAGIEADYRRRLHRLVQMMEKSVKYWVHAAYKGNEPATVTLAHDDVISVPESLAMDALDYALAMDESAVAALRRVIRALVRRWQRNFNEAADELAKYFSREIATRSDNALRRTLKQGGYSVPFTQTPVMRDALNAVIAENVGLIRSIPREYLRDIEGAVMRAAAAGRDLSQLTADVQRIGGVTRRRATLIARDQTNKATTYMTRARQIDVGIDEGIWRHSHAGKVPRPTHVAQDGKRFSLRDGWRDPAIDKLIFPGTEINCRCFWTPVIKGM